MIARIIGDFRQGHGAFAFAVAAQTGHHKGDGRWVVLPPQREEERLSKIRRLNSMLGGNSRKFLIFRTRENHHQRLGLSRVIRLFEWPGVSHLYRSFLRVIHFIQFIRIKFCLQNLASGLDVKRKKIEF